MASSLLALIDDIATILDDVSVMTKVAAKKTSGVLGDDLALNAEQVTGVDASREIPVVLAVAKGSFINKVILVPLALLLSQFLPFLIKPLLVLGGLFLCFEGFEKVYEKFLFWIKKNKANEFKSEIINSSSQESLTQDEKTAIEKNKIKGAITTDFILSAEIIVISLGTVADQPLLKQASVLTLISILMTVGVYGLVGGIVKIDDLGLMLLKKSSNFLNKIGTLLIQSMPYLMKSLGVIGTIAMFMVGGGLVVHSISFLHHLQEGFSPLLNTFIEASVGFICGGIIVLIHHIIHALKK